MLINDKIFGGYDNRLLILFIALITALVYANSLTNSFVADDYLVIVDNNFVKQWKNIPLILSKEYFTPDSKLPNLGQGFIGSGEASYRPMVTISYFIDYSIWKLNPFGYHFTNILLHIVNSILLFVFINLIAKNKITAFLASMFFALHPVNTEAVNVISFREDLIAFLFYISSFILFIKSKQYLNKKTAYISYIGLSVILFSLALLSKEMAVTLPIMLFLYDYLFVPAENQKGFPRYLKPRYIGYIVVLLLYSFLFAFLIKGFSLEYSPGNFFIQIAKLVEAFFTYIKWLLVPVDAHFTFLLSSRPMLIPIGLFIAKALLSVLLIIVCFIVIKARNTPKEISFAILWFFITLLPVSNILPMQNFMGCRYLYIPIAGFCFLLAMALVKLPALNVFSIKRSILYKASKITIISLLIFYSTYVVINSLAFKNNTVFWLRVVEDYPNSEMAHIALGADLIKNGNLDKAEEELNIGIGLAPEYTKAECYNIVGMVYYRSNVLDKAIESFDKAIKQDPNFVDAYNNRALAHSEIKD